MEKPIFIDHRKKKRPELLTLLCILTFIYSGLQTLSNLFMLLNRDFISDNIEGSGFQLEDLQPILDMPSLFFLLNTFLFTAVLVGAIYMWSLKKIGFHIYTLAQIALLFVISIFNPFNITPFAEILMTSMFILLYYRHLKFMTR